MFLEVEMAIPQEGTPDLGHVPDLPDEPDEAEVESRTPGQTTLTAHAFRMT